MSYNLSNLTEAAQKNLTAISNKISIQKKIIERERSVKNAKVSETYKALRAKSALQTFTTRLTKADTLLHNHQERLEEERNILKEHFNTRRKELEEKQKLLDKEFDTKEKELEKCFSSEKTILENKISDLEKNIETQEKIIWDETNKESDIIIRANTEIESLKKERDAILNVAGVYTTSQPPNIPPPAQRVSEPLPEPVQENYEQSLDFALFMRDGRQDGQPINPNPSYLSSVALGACMTKKEKEIGVKKGIKMP